MLKYGLAYGLLSSRRRAREMLLPAITIATGAFLVVVVFAMSAGIKKQAAGLGHADEIGHAVVLIAVTVLLVGVIEAAVATTRTIAHRTRELGVLGATGVRSLPVLVALLVEPLVTAFIGALAGAVIAAAAAAESWTGFSAPAGFHKLVKFTSCHFVEVEQLASVVAP